MICNRVVPIFENEDGDNVILYLYYAIEKREVCYLINKMRITFIFGAGCEGKGQYGLPSGCEFKRETILASNVKTLFSNLNSSDKGISIENGTIIKHNSTSILYQTLSECKEKFEFSDEERRIVDSYLEKKHSGDSSDESVSKKFLDLYRKSFYYKLKDLSAVSIDPNLTFFLERACFFEFMDSSFNYLRKPLRYKNEVSRVVKTYYSAYLSVVNGMYKACDKYLDADVRNEWNRLLTKSTTIKGGIADQREVLSELVSVFQDSLIENINKGGYYYRIKEFLNEHGDSFDASFVTTNYTEIAEKILSEKSMCFAYLHGKLKWFEEIFTKRVDELQNFSEKDLIMPFIFIQSGIKPIVSPMQLREYSKALDAIDNSDYLIILGYGINSDDEHISNIIRERILGDKKVICFIYECGSDYEEKCKSVKDELFPGGLDVKLSECLIFRSTDAFEPTLEELANGTINYA